MLKQPIYVEFNLDAKVNSSKLIAISHVDDKYSETLEVAVKQNDRFVYMGGADVVARMVLHRDKDYLLSDNVACSVNDNGNIMIPFDNAVVKTSQGVVKIEVNITRDTDELTLQFPLWVSVNGSILENAEVTPDSEGTIPELLEQVRAELSRVQPFEDGASAYEIAVDHGYSGTEQEWLRSLKGDSVIDAEISNGYLVLTILDHTTQETNDVTAGYVRGTDGTNGTNGDGYTDAAINANGELVLTKVFGNGTATDVNLGRVVGAAGQDYILTAADKAEIAQAVEAEVVDPTLSVSGAAADAKKAGDKMREIGDILDGFEAPDVEISGEILSFNYQGETVREISVAASGASSSVLTVCGKNIYPKYTSGSQSNLSWTVAQDGTITFSGTPSADVMLRLQNLSIPAAGKELTLAMFNNMTSARLTVFMVNSENSDNKQLNLSATNATLTATHTTDIVEMRIRIPKNIDWTGLTLKPMFVYGSSAGDFEAYSGQSHNVTLSGGVVQEDIPLHNGVNTVWASNGDTAITFAGQSGTVTGYVAAQINSIQNQFYRCAASGGAKYVYVYFKSGDYYVCYELHNVPSAASNSDTWQLGHTTACKIASDGTISDVVELIDGGEYELAMRENGAADYCGGNNHGDENTVTFKLFADGKQISDFSAAADGKLRPFNRIDAFDISLVDRCDTPGDNIAQHQKHWTFENGKVEVQQSLKFLQNLRLDVVLLCMCCARRDQFPYGIRQGGVAIEDMSSGGFPHLTTRSNEISYFYFGNNATMNIKAKTDSPTISALFINDVTNAQRQQNKLYYGYYQATNSANPTSVSAGDVIQETSVYDIAYMAATE